MSKAQQSNQVRWSEIDKVRFYGIGTAMYSAITLTLHPITVMKTRQQVLHSTSNTFVSNATFANNMRIYYRGVGIILLLAVPARGMYIGVLENSKEHISSMIQSAMESQSLSSSSFIFSSVDMKIERNLPLIASISGGLAGGLASMSSQSITVPMDVVSQRQMVMNDSMYTQEGNAVDVVKRILKVDGIAGFYRGFGMSLFTSLPTGTLWWGTYSGCQQFLQRFEYFHQQRGHDGIDNVDETTQLRGEVDSYIQDLIRRGLYQGICGVSAAIVAATLTQPLDVVRTRLQVGTYGQTSKLSSSPSQMNNTYSAVVKDLYTSSGFRGFFKGTAPRVASFCMWGTILSSAYEYLRYISKKDYEFFPK